MYVFFDSEYGNGKVRTGRISELGLRGAWAIRFAGNHGKGYWEFGKRFPY